MLKILGYYLSGNRSSRESFYLSYRQLYQVIPTWLELKGDGSLHVKDFKDDLEILSKYKTRESIVPMVQNFNLDSKVSNQLINNNDYRKKAIDNLLIFMGKHGLRKINVDLEGVKVSYKKNLTLFIKELSSVLKEKGYHLTISIPARTENTKDYSWSGAYDYGKLGLFVDGVIIMAYDYHWSGGPPGPVSPLPWVRDVLDYAIIEIPATKIFLGLPFYGYDWELNQDKPARGLSHHQIFYLIKEYDSQVEWDQEFNSPYFRYKQDGKWHEVWFENKTSLAKKIKLAEDFQINGVAFWRLGLEDKNFWKLLSGGKVRG
ncbi:glycosyl hydrolase family 18 protein [Halothermothrix orenii]|uniref:Inactive glysosyl hydrolase family 18 n=1 Tax=Halothermothrix orenii (strain H 168 / OCM 544 / DSM 9562) TaxID=373903 RepID=B8D0H7_HALOH|nr:glycosyl hydrolase family 18 protein [Halothermothrix orenii]ACL70913.1 Inactive glysosyl hydrolase family 18 [Halothermothrix orenii H 168]